MSDINLDFTVSNNSINFTVEPNEITITPTDIQLRILSGGVGLPGGSTGQLQYNNSGALGGVPNTSYNGTNLTLGNVSNIKITGGSANYALLTDGSGNLSWASIETSEFANYANFAGEAFSLNSDVSNVQIDGGTNGYVLQTDGAGNLSWTAQTGGGGGNGVPGGANTQIQYNDSGSFGGNSGFTFNEVSGNVNLPSNLIVATRTTTANLNVSATANLGNISNVKIQGGANNYSIITDGTGNLSFAAAGAGGSWSNVANLGLNDIFIGTLLGSNTAVAPGNTIDVNTILNANGWSVVNTGITAGLLNVTSTDNYIWSSVGNSEANVARTTSGVTWTKVATPFVPTYAPIQAGTNLVIWQSGSNRAAYSTNDGANWTNANTVNTTLNLSAGAYGSNTLIVIRSETINNTFIRSTDFGLTWANVNTGQATYTMTDIAYGNSKFIAISRNGVVGGQPVLSKRSTDFGTSWANITLPTTYGNLWTGIAYGNGKWVAVSEYTGSTNRGTSIVSTDDGNTWTQTLLANTNWNEITYANGYFVASDSYSGNIIYSSDGTTWTTVDTGIGINNGGSIAYNSKENLLINASDTGLSNVAVALTPKIVISGSDGNLSNGISAPFGTYKSLGGVLGNVGAMWIKTT